MTGIRVLTVRQPWAHAIVHLGKDVENRSRSLGGYTGPVAIQASKRIAHLTPAQLALIESHADDTIAAWLDGEPIVGGAIIGVVDLVETHADGTAECSGLSEWAEHGAHHLVLANPRALDAPITWKGGLGLRKSRLDIAGNWLVEQTDTCNCQAGSLESAYAHAPGCGLEQVARLIGEPS